MVKNDFKANWMEVFSFTAGGNPWKNKHLLPIPTVGICNGYLGKHGQSFDRVIFINVPLIGKKFNKKVKFDLGKKYHIKIQQFKDNKDENTILKIEVNGKIIFLGKNTTPSELNNVKVYVSDPWLYPFTSEYGKLENFKYISGNKNEKNEIVSVSGGNLLEILPKWGSVFTVEADITVTKIVEGTVQTFFATRYINLEKDRIIIIYFININILRITQLCHFEMLLKPLFQNNPNNLNCVVNYENFDFFFCITVYFT